MASTRLIPGVLRAAPVATLVLLLLWTVLDLLSFGDFRRVSSLLGFLAAGGAGLSLSSAFRWDRLRPVGLAMVAAVYLAAHATILGVQVVPGLVFVVLLICHVELRVLAERFATLYEATLTPTDRARIRGALGRAVGRLTVAAVLAVVVPIIAANLAVAGVVPLTTIPSAILLAGALVAVVLLIAILPTLERNTA